MSMLRICFGIWVMSRGCMMFTPSYVEDNSTSCSVLGRKEASAGKLALCYHL